VFSSPLNLSVFRVYQIVEVIYLGLIILLQPNKNYENSDSYQGKQKIPQNGKYSVQLQVCQFFQPSYPSLEVIDLVDLPHHGVAVV